MIIAFVFRVARPYSGIQMKQSIKAVILASVWKTLFTLRGIEMITKKNFRKILSGCVGAALTCTPLYAVSSVISYDMTGEAVFSSNPIPGINIGDSFSASLTYDSTLLTSTTFDVTPPFGVVSSSITYHTGSGDVTYTSNTTSDAHFVALNDRVLGGDIVDEIQITFDTGIEFDPRIFFRFIDYDATAFSASLTTFPSEINLADWEFAGITLIDSSVTQQDVRGDITSLTRTADVPEPGMFALLGIGLIGLGLTGRKKA